MSVIDLSQLPAPNLLEELDFESLLQQMKTSFNELQPSLLDVNQRPVILDAELVQTANGERYWKVPVGEESGLYYLEHESDPIVKQLEQFVYREMQLRQRVNEAAKALLVAYAQGADLDNVAADLNVQRLDGEGDDRLRQRRQMALESFTTAGSKGAYEYHALTSDINVLDVNIARPTFKRIPLGQFIQTILAGEGVAENTLILGIEDNARLSDPIPGDVAVTVLPIIGADKEATKAKVSTALNPDTVIPFTDNPILLDSEVISYVVNAELTLYSGPSSEPVIDLAHVALSAYTSTHARLGHNIARSGLDAAAHQDGVQSVKLNINDDIIVQPWQVARCTGINVTVGGRDV